MADDLLSTPMVARIAAVRDELASTVPSIVALAAADKLDSLRRPVADSVLVKLNELVAPRLTAFGASSLDDAYETTRDAYELVVSASKLLAAFGDMPQSSGIPKVLESLRSAASHLGLVNDGIRRDDHLLRAGQEAVRDAVKALNGARPDPTGDGFRLLNPTDVESPVLDHPRPVPSALAGEVAPPRQTIDQRPPRRSSDGPVR
jgi:hypothetical protein